MDGSTEVLVTIPEVQLHEVKNGKEALLEWGELTVSIHTDQGVSGVWLKVGRTEWSIDAASPTLKAASNTYMFAMGDGRFYSLLLANGTAADSAALFEGILSECSSFEGPGGMSQQDTEQAVAEVAAEMEDDTDLPMMLARPQQAPGVKPTTSDRIISGAAVVQEKLAASANWASQKLLEQSRALQAKTEPNANPSKISPEMVNRVKLARRAAEKSSRMANRVAGGIANKLADSIVNRVGPGDKVSEELNNPNPDSRRHAAKEVASAAVVAAVGIYDSMEQAAKLVLHTGGNATSEFIGHKYGAAAGEVAKDATHASLKASMTVMTMQKIGVKKIAKRIAKRTAMGLAKSYIAPGNSSGSSNALPQAGAAPARLTNAGGEAQPAAGVPSTGAATPASGLSNGYPAQQHAAPTAQAVQMNHAAGTTTPPPMEGSMPAPWEYRSPFAN